MTTRLEKGHPQSASKVAVRRAALLEDVEFLIASREYPEQIVKRLGFRSFRTLQSRLYRMGRNDLVLRVTHAPEIPTVRTGTLCRSGRSRTT